MYALWLVVFMDGTACDAVAVCGENEASCEATIVSCEAPVSLDACLNAAAAFTQRELADGEAELLEPIYGLGCSTDLSAGWPATVDFDADEMERAQ